MPQPPRIAQHILGLILHPVDRDVVLGDLEEIYRYKAEKEGKRKAGQWYWGQALRSVPALLGRSLYWSLFMLKNYLKTTFRSFKKQKGYALLNISGLAIGIAASMLILLWVRNEVGYNKQLEGTEQTYQARRIVMSNGELSTRTSMPKPLAETLKSDYPEIVETALVHWESDYVLKSDERVFRVRGHYTSTSFFDLFPFPFILGNPESVLDDINSIVITESLATTLFGSAWRLRDDVLGHTLSINHKKDYSIAGVIENPSAQNTFEFEILLPIEEFYANVDWVDHWGSNGLQLFAKSTPGVDVKTLNEKIANAITQHYDEEDVDVFLQAFEDTYLYSSFEDGVQVGGRIEYVQIFAMIGVFLLLIAAFNFTNLSTARSSKRSREIGVRKALGANRNSLIAQFLGESMIFAGLGFLVALALVILLMPAFNELTGKTFSFRDLDVSFFGGAFLITMMVGIVAGGYPALYLSSFKPLSILRGRLLPNRGPAVLRKGLVTLQFVLSVLLIVSTLAVYLQIQFIQNRDLGLDRENVIYLAQEGAFRTQFDVVRDELLKRPGIAQVTASNSSPLSIGSSTGGVQWAGKSEGLGDEFYIVGTEYDFVETMKMELVEGRAFSREYGADSSSFLINEKMAEMIGDAALGTELSFWGYTGPVVGVIKDFDMNSLYSSIQPVVIGLTPGETRSIYIRTKPGETEAAIASLTAVFEQFNQGYPFEYHFMDEAFERSFRSEVVLGKLARVFAIIAIFITCLGLLGLISYAAEQRAKEIGIRKVLGASVMNLVTLLMGEITLLVMLGFVIASPIGYWLVSDWLSGFDKHIEMGPMIFIGAGIGAILIAWATVSFQAIKSAVVNPVKSLKHE